jgi:GNAT superfamily N-acetyltransferase
VTPRFRTAALADLPAIVALLAEDTVPLDRETDVADPRYRAAFDAVAADPAQLLVVAELDARVVGTLQLTIIPGLSFRGMTHGLIESVRIASDLRGRGLGTAMLGWAVERCRERGCGLVQLTSTNTREAAHRFYRRLGWQQTHAGFKLPLQEIR